jgi:tRNA-Thr(GGU) m(6)t(6)A37 methyltransferase TsaA
VQTRVNLKSIQLRAIGRVRCKFSEEEIKRKRSSIVSEVLIDKKYAKALDGIEDYSHLFIIFFLHKVPLRDTKGLKIHPRGRTDMKKVGIFATRSRSHPNTIGLAVVKLLKRRGNSLKVQALDAIDGTPVLDIKPYDYIDIQKNIHVPDWWHKLKLS